MEEMRECKKHGLTRHFYGTRIWRCRKCGTEAVQRRRDKVKILAVEYKGGKCEICSYDECIACLSFHHKDPNEKDFGISHKGYTRSWEKVKMELDKCTMLCMNCHTKLHWLLTRKN